ncbi:MAG: ribonuclease P protein component [Alphaproteobacteria bacterium]
MVFKRLKKRRDFVNIAKYGVFTKGFSIVVQCLKKEEGECHIGFTVTKRMGNAVMRNRIKRRLRAAVYTLKSSLHFITKSYDFVIITNKNALNIGFLDLKMDILNTVKKVIEKT